MSLDNLDENPVSASAWPWSRVHDVMLMALVYGQYEVDEEGGELTFTASLDRLDSERMVWDIMTTESGSVVLTVRVNPPGL